MPWFLQCCKKCSDVDWLILTDREFPQNPAANVHFRAFSISDLERLVSGKTGSDYRFSFPYKVCDMKPAYGDFFCEYLAEYDYWGYCDLDVINGDLGRWIRCAVDSGADVITASSRLLVGHFTLLKNSSRLRELYRLCAGWEQKFHETNCQIFDEKDFSQLVKNLAERSEIRLVDQPLWQEDLLIYWTGRPGFVMFWSKGQLWDLLILRQYGYFHFIKTKQLATIASGCRGKLSACFYMTSRGFGRLASLPEWCVFSCVLIWEFLRTMPWYSGRVIRLLLPQKLRRWLGGRASV